MVTVSVCIPFYNAASFLEMAILSVLNQTYSDWELLLIDDGSKDDSLRIAKSFECTKIRIFSDGENKGLVYRLNQSVALARGKYYARMDADDIMHPDRLKLQIAYFFQYPQTDVVGTSWYSIDEKNRVLNMKQATVSPTKYDILLKNRICFCHPSVMGKVEWFKNNLYDVAYVRMEDYELWLRTIDKSVFHSLEEPLMFYREFGVPVWKKYMRTQLSALKLFQNGKKYGISWPVCAWKIIETIFKLCIYTFFSFFSFTDFLIRLRSKNGLSLEAKEKGYGFLYRAINYNTILYENNASYHPE